VAYKDGFQRGQRVLGGPYNSVAEAGRQQTGHLGDAFAGKVYEKTRSDGYTLGIALSKGKYYVVLNPPGVTSYEK
jgi:hypothetical protein